MTPELQKKMMIGQALIWIAMIVTQATIKIVLDNTGRFTFGNVTMFGPIVWIVFFSAAQFHLQSIVKRIPSADSSPD